MNILLYGIQGSGKSTQGKLLAQHLHLPYLSTGHIFRDMAKESNREGRYIKETLAAGLLVPDEITIPIVEKYLGRTEYKKGWILDGFPRTISQAEKFKTKIDAAFYLLVPDKEALWRLSFRMGSKGEIREDETLMAIRKRIDLFHKATEPVLEYYRKRDLLVEINGEKKVEEICEDLIGKIRWYQKGNEDKR